MPKMKEIELVRVDFESKKKTRLALFRMIGNKLSSSWTKDGASMKRIVEQDGIAFQGTVLYPSDGQKFFDALPIAYSQSSLVYAKPI